MKIFTRGSRGAVGEWVRKGGEVVKTTDALLEKIHALVKERDDLVALLARNEAELSLYRTFVSQASLDPSHV
jgi:hypothetical protein